MAQVPATSYESTSLGDVAEFTIPFPFLSRAEVFVTVDGASVPFTWINDGLVQLAAVPELGAIVRRYRSTAAYVPLHQFSTGVPFLPRYVDRDFKQTLYAVQESVNDTANTSALALETAEQALAAVQDSFDILSERTQYIVLGPYGPGLNFQTTSQVFSYLGEFYSPGPAITLPYTTTGAGAGEIANFRSVGDAILRADLADSADSEKGSALVGHMGRTVAASLNDRVNAASYLNGNTQTQALQAATTAALATGKALYIPGGTWLIDSQITGAGANLSILGDGVGITKVIFTATSGGFAFTFDPQTAGVMPDQCQIRDLTIESRAAVSSPAFSAEWTTYQPNAQGTFWAENLSITRKADGTGSFTAGIQLTKCVGGFLNNIAMVGDDLRVSNYGLSFIDCVELICNNIKVNRYKEGVRIDKVVATQSEGILFTACFFFDVYRGVNVASQAIHINVTNCHININGSAAECCISFLNVAQGNISGCLLYVGGVAGNPPNQDAIRLIGRNSNTVTNNRVNALVRANSRYGLLLSSDASFNAVVSNQFAGFNEGLRLSGAAQTSNTLAGNEFYDCTVNIVGLGTGTFRSGNLAIPPLGVALAIDTLRWGTAVGSFNSGEISVSSSWGTFIKGYAGAESDVSLVDSAGAVCFNVKSGAAGFKAYAKASLPSAALKNGGCGFIYVTDDVGGAVPAFSDGTNWRRVTDRAIIA